MHRDAEGYYQVIDRISDMYISGGESISPAEVENVLAGHPAVADIAVFGVPDERWGEVGIAAIVVRAGVATDEEDLLGFCAGKLAAFKIPKAVVFVDQIPRSGGNKVLRRVLADRYRSTAKPSTRSTR